MALAPYHVGEYVPDYMAALLGPEGDQYPIGRRVVMAAVTVPTLPTAAAPASVRAETQPVRAIREARGRWRASARASWAVVARLRDEAAAPVWRRLFRRAYLCVARVARVGRGGY